MQPQDPQQPNVQPPIPTPTPGQPIGQPPTPGTPPIAGPEPSPMQPQMPMYPSAPSAEPTQPGAPKLKWILIALAVLLLLAGAATFYFLHYSKDKPSKRTKTDDTVVTTLQQKPTLAAADIQAVDKDNAFYAYVKKAAQEKKAVITKASRLTGSTTEDTFSKVGVDYDTKQVILASETEFEGKRDRIRCHDGVQDDYSGIYGEWNRYPDATNCKQDKLYGEATDGFNAGGLTTDQAETFVAYLRSRDGLIDVKKLQLADHQGKTYLHFTVALNQIKVDSTHYGAQWLMFAFKETGLNPDTYPYGFAGAGGEGFTLEYYVDPTTGLPAYSELTALVPRGDSSGNKTGDYHYRVQYDFASGTFDATPANNSDIAITW